MLLSDDTNRAEWLHFPGPKLDQGTKYPETVYAQHYGWFLPGRGSDYWDREGIWLCGLESLWSHSRHTLKILATIKGAIGACLPTSLPVIETSAGEWRRTLGLPVTGPKRELKMQAMVWAKDEWANRNGMETEDACDAYCIARATRLLNEGARAA